MTFTEKVDEFLNVSSKNGLPETIEVLKVICSLLGGPSNEGIGVNYVPGINFKYCHPESTEETLDKVYFAIISNRDLCKSEEKLCGNVITQIASFSFGHFVDKLFPSLLDYDDTVKLKVLCVVARIVIDPTTGFYKNAPQSPKNDHWHDLNHHYNFFDEESPDLNETQFGKAILRFRDEVHKIILKFMQTTLENCDPQKINQTFYVPSFFDLIQSVIVPPSFRLHDLACGFPARAEFLLAISQFQEIDFFSKKKSSTYNRTKPIARQYSEMNERITGIRAQLSNDFVKFAKPVSLKDDIYISLTKLFPLCDTLLTSNREPQHVFYKLILYNSPKLAPFFLSLAQPFSIAYPIFAFTIFDDLMNEFKNLFIFTPEQHHTYFHTLSRLVDSLACLPTRYLEDQRIVELNALGLFGLGSSLPKIRSSALKLIKTVGTFETGTADPPLSQLLESNFPIFEEYLLKFFEDDPVVLMSREKLTPLMPLPFVDAMVSTDCIIWQYMYSAVGAWAAESLPIQTLNVYKKLAIDFVKWGNLNGDSRINHRLANTLTFLGALADSPISVLFNPITKEMSEDSSYDDSPNDNSSNEDFSNENISDFEVLNGDKSNIDITEKNAKKEMNEVKELIKMKEMLEMKEMMEMKEKKKMKDKKAKEKREVKEAKEQLELSDQILDQLIKTISDMADNTSYPMIKVMLMPLNIASFPNFLRKIGASSEPKVVAIALKSMAWNKNFTAVSEHREFFTMFLDTYMNTFTSFDWGDLFNSVVPSITKEHFKIVTDNMSFINDCVLVGYKVFSMIYNDSRSEIDTPFPSTDYVVDTEREDILKIRPLFYLLFNLARIRAVSPRLHRFALSAFTQWLACSRIENISFVWNETFSNIVHDYSFTSPELLFHMLCHHFDLLFATYLQLAAQIGGANFFAAIALYFRATHIGGLSLGEILKRQWLSCADNKKDSIFMKNLQIIYENCGYLIYCCILYMNTPDLDLTESALVVLGSLAPVLSVFHMRGRPDYVERLEATFLGICNRLGQSIRCIDYQTLLETSRTMSECFSFCMEQFFAVAFECLPSFSDENIDRMLFLMSPWFENVSFDVENRIISKETDLLFLNFSCYSFVDKLMMSFKKVSNNDMNSSYYETWRVLVSSNGSIGSNFMPILLSVLYDGYSKANHGVVFNIVYLLYRIAPKAVIDVVCLYLSFDRCFYDSVISIGNAADDLSHVLGDDFKQSAESNDLSMFCFSALARIVLDGIRPLVPHIPLIFAASIIHFDKYFNEIQVLLINILKAMVPLVAIESIQLIQGLHCFIGTTSRVQRPDDRIHLSNHLTNLLLSIDKKMATQFGIEILKWGLCCPDLYRGIIALKCFQGNLLVNSNLAIGLFARSIWSVSDAIHTLENNPKIDLTLYIKYMTTAIDTLTAIAQSGASNSNNNLMMLWIALDTLRINNNKYKEIFECALNLIENFLVPENFLYISGRGPYKYNSYSENSFWKFHQPWSDTYCGALNCIMEYEGSVNINLILKIINKLIQIQFPPLLSPRPNSVAVGILALLPWMCSVFVNDIARFLFNSLNIQQMTATIEAAEPFIEDKSVIENLSLLYTNEKIDIFEVMGKVVGKLIPIIGEDDVIKVCHFYSNSITSTEKEYIIHLYTIITQILNSIKNVSKAAASLERFTSYAKNDTKPINKQYIKLYFKALPKENLTLWTSNDETFPEINIYERIVAINVPHLYDLELDEVQLTNFNDLNSFPPLLPNDRFLLNNERFNSIYRTQKKLRSEPYYTYQEMLYKLQTSLVDFEDSDVRKHFEKISNFPIKTIFRESLEKVLHDISIVEQSSPILTPVPSLPKSSHEKLMTIEEEIDPNDPYDFIMIKKKMFVPTKDLLRNIVTDILGNI